MRNRHFITAALTGCFLCSSAIFSPAMPMASAAMPVPTAHSDNAHEHHANPSVKNNDNKAMESKTNERKDKPLTTEERAAKTNATPEVPVPEAERQAIAQMTMPRKWRFVPSTEQSIVFTFGGLTKREALEPILIDMSENNMRGTFFVTDRELRQNRDNIDLIASYGQDLAIGLRPLKDATYDDYMKQISYITDTLREDYGVETIFARQMTGKDDEALMSAAEASGLQLIGQGFNVVQSRHKNAESADEVMPTLAGKAVTSLNRGEIVYIRTDFYTRATLADEIMMMLKKEKIDNIAYRTFDDTPETNPDNTSGYSIVSLEDAYNSPHRYSYPVDVATLPREMQPGYMTLPEVNDDNFKAQFLRRYIGAPQVSENDRMLDFNRDLMRLCDKSGVVKTVTDNTIFLTFDDWGLDDSVNKLLYVLRKHHAPATFFIISRNIENNPNLLRAIVEEGHEVGSHTDQHMPMAIYNEEGDKMVPTLDEPHYLADVATSYAKLAAAIGDARLANGRPALTHLMRPPTLAISRMGLKSLMNTGFTFIVNGYGSTEDYGAVSLQSLEGIMGNLVTETVNGTRMTRRGSILIMHMSGTATKTARALDILLTENDVRPDNDPMKFKIGLLGDYLDANYDQMIKQEKR